MHKQWEDLIPFYVAGTLSPKEATALENHLAQCEECRQQFTEWRSIAAAVWQSASSEARGLPPLSQHVLEAVHNTSSNTHIVAPPAPKRIVTLPPRAKPKRGAFGRLIQTDFQVPLTLVAAIAVALVVVGLLVYMSLPYGDPEDTATANDGTGVAALSAPVEDTETPAGEEDLGVLLPTTLAVTPSPQLPPTVAITPFSNTNPNGNGIGGGGGEDLFALSQPNVSAQMDVQTSACYAVNNQRDIVNIYALPGIQYDLVDVLNPGERIEVFTGGENGWYQTIRIMEPRAITGWIDGSLVSLEGICNELPMPTPTPAGTITPVSQQCLVSSASTSDGVDMYAGPGTTYQIINTIRPQVTAIVMAQSDNGWYQVSYTALSRTWIGWVNQAEVLQYFNCENLSVIRSEGYIPESTPVLAPTATVSAVITPIGSASDVVYFTAFPTTASVGDTLTLRWETRDAENIWIELYPAGTNVSSPNFVPDVLYSDLSPTGTLQVTIPEDFTGSVLQISLILDRYDRVGRADGESVIVQLED